MTPRALEKSISNVYSIERKGIASRRLLTRPSPQSTAAGGHKLMILRETCTLFLLLKCKCMKVIPCSTMSAVFLGYPGEQHRSLEDCITGMQT